MTDTDRNDTDLPSRTRMDEPGAEELAALMRSATPGFAPGFAHRVMDRLGAELAVDPLAAVMVRQFRRLVPLAIAATLALAAFNLAQARNAQRSTVEALFGLEPVSLGYSYSIEIPGMTDTEALP